MILSDWQGAWTKVSLDKLLFRHTNFFYKMLIILFPLKTDGEQGALQTERDHSCVQPLPDTFQVCFSGKINLPYFFNAMFIKI